MSRLLFILLLVCHAAVAAPIGETRAFRTGIEIFRDRKYDVAEQNLSDFLAKYPNSEFRAEAVLYQAKARVHLKKQTEAIQLLEQELPRAGLYADQYRYWIAEAFFQTGSFEVASEKYADVVRNHLDSPLVLEAAYNKALCFAKLENWKKVIELLGPDRSFRTLSASKPNDRFTIQGILLLAEALFAEKQFAEGEAQLSSLAGRTMDENAQWRHQFLLAQTQFAQKNFAAALGSISNAVSLARSLGPRQVADSTQVQAEILESSGRLSEAVEIYEQNLAPASPNAVRRQALFKAIELTIAQGQTPQAITKLEQFVAQNTNDTALDLAHFTLGELRLKQIFDLEHTSTNDGNQVISSNLLQSALTNFSTVITAYPQSEVIGKTYLNRGWCRWIEENFPEAQTNFAEAVVRLPVSEEQGIARFKLADTLFRTGDYSGAVSNYNLLIREFAEYPAVKSTLFDQALYQIVRASLHNNDAESAREAMVKILEWYPHSGYADRSVLLVGLGLNRKGSATEARRLFSEFLKGWPESPLAADVKLALAQTYVREGQWPEALTSLENWITAYTNSALLPQAEFGRALATYHTGTETNALNLLHAFITKHATNPLAAMAQNWIGDYFFNREDYARAEENYQLVNKLNPSLEVACQAKIGGGRAAFSRDDFKNARDYFRDLINDKNTPSNFLFEAYIGLGDTTFSQFLTNTLTPAEDFSDAVTAYSKVTKETNALAALAWGRLGECHLQWGNLFKEPSAYVDAAKAFQQVLDSPVADLQARSLARLGLGKVFEASGKPVVAWGHYAQLIYVGDNEDYDPKCVKEAGLAAARLCENEGQWEEAMNVYRRLLILVPSLKPAVEKKMASARANLEAIRN